MGETFTLKINKKGSKQRLISSHLFPIVFNLPLPFSLSPSLPHPLSSFAFIVTKK